MRGLATLILFLLACRQADPAPQMRAALASMRKAIQHAHHPHSLQDLVRQGELRAIPIDPVTKSPDTWHTTLRENVTVDDFTTSSSSVPPEIIDVHSGATGTDAKGRAWSDY